MARTGQSIAELTADLKVFPQVTININVREKRPLDSIPAVAQAIRAAEEDLRDSGRVVVRYSGTESLARVMVEAATDESTRHHATAIADAVRAELGS
jgi:phosphoglucosamine mutase